MKVDLFIVLENKRLGRITMKNKMAIFISTIILCMAFCYTAESNERPDFSALRPVYTAKRVQLEEKKYYLDLIHPKLLIIAIESTEMIKDTTNEIYMLEPVLKDINESLA